MTAQAKLFVALGLAAVVLLGGVLLLAGVGVSALYFWPPRNVELADAGPHAKVVPADPKEKDKPEPPPAAKEKDKPAPPRIKPPVHRDIDPSIVFSISLKEPQRTVLEILFAGSKTPLVGVYRSRGSVKESTEQFELFDVATKESVARLDLPAARYSPCPRSLSPDGKYFARGTILEGRKFSIWAFGNPVPIVADWSLTKSEKSANFGGYLSSFHLLEDDRLLTFSGAGDMELWRIPEMHSLWKVPGPKKFFYSSPIGGTVSPDRQRCAVFTGDNFRIHDTRTGELICETAPVPTQKDKAMAARSRAFSADNALLVANMDGAGLKPAVYCYDAKTGNLKSSVPIEGESLSFRVGWFGARHYFLSASTGRGQTKLYRASDGVKVAELLPGEASKSFQVGFHSPDPRLWYALMQSKGRNEVKLVAAPLPVELDQDRPGAAALAFRFSEQGLAR